MPGFKFQGCQTPPPEGTLRNVGWAAPIQIGPIHIVCSVWQSRTDGALWINADLGSTAGGQGVEMWARATREISSAEVPAPRGYKN